MGGGPPGFGLGFTCPALLGIPLGWSGVSGTGLSPPAAGLSRPFPYALPIPRLRPATPPGEPGGLGSGAFARSYLRHHCCFLFLRVLRCFTSPGVALGGYGLTPRAPPFPAVGCPIRRSTDQSVLAAPRGLSQLAASFVALRCQGIRRMPVSACAENRFRAPTSRGGALGPGARCGIHLVCGKSLRMSKSKRGWRPAIARGAGGRDWSRTSDLVLIRDAL